MEEAGANAWKTGLGSVEVIGLPNECPLVVEKADVVFWKRIAASPSALSAHCCTEYMSNIQLPCPGNWANSIGLGLPSS